MDLCISNIAWSHEHDAEVAKWMVGENIRNLEVAPAKVVGPDQEPARFTFKQADTYRQFWQDHNIRIVAMQALLYGAQESLHLFEHTGPYEDYLKRIIELSGLLGAKALVLGSPKQRTRGTRTWQHCIDVATPVLQRLGTFAQQHHCQLNIEPNAPHYGCDFVNNLTEALELVNQVDQPGFGLHLDSAAMVTAEDWPDEWVSRLIPYFNHVHISEDQLGPVGECIDPLSVDLQTSLISNLHFWNYSGAVSIEMTTTGSPLDHIKQAANYVKKLLRDTRPSE